jgi:succinyl-diaminopimelate desuccinylase
MIGRAKTAALLLFTFPLVAFGQGTHERAEKVRAVYEQKYASKLVPMLTEALRFPTVEGNTTARDQQQAWIARVAPQLGLTVRNAGLVTEVELPGPDGAPVLGLVVHGDVQPVNEAEWAFAPFSGVEKNGVVYGRGAADDKGPLVQALLALASLKDSGVARTHTIRLLVGSDEESTNLDITTYLKDHKAPELSLVLDSGFPVVVGEKAWTAFTVTAADAYKGQPMTRRPPWLFTVTRLDAGLAASIVPSRADADLQFDGDQKNFAAALQRLKSVTVPKGYKLDVKADGHKVHVTAWGHAAHAGVNLEGGRNAMVFLATVLDGNITASPAAALLEFAKQAGSDIHGSGLSLPGKDPLWGNYAVNVATIKPDKQDEGKLTLTINIRANPAMYGAPLRAHLEKKLAAFNAEHHENFTAGGFYDDPPLAFDPNGKLVKRLMADYSRATGENPSPAISGGGTYAKRLPNAIAFGMWFPGKPYPGHDVDEQITVKDLDRGVNVLVEALADVACSPSIEAPFKP